MCGITGYFGNGNQEILKKMTQTLHHRGPDDEGFYIDKNVGLGHKRLAIIDLSDAGRQPISNEKKNIFVIFNGEIYNFLELKKTLKQKHYFESNTDTEVILHLYEEIGVEVFNKLNGMFAIAIYDIRINTLILARDKMGKKPLYWGKFNDTFIFGSELKALAQHPNFKKELDLMSLNKYLSYEYVPTPHSIFKNTYKLEPGHYLQYVDGNVIKHKFWDISFQSSIKNHQLRIEEAVHKLDEKVNNSVKLRLVSDVPLGIFLSGGIDSSTIAYYAQKNSAQKIKTFSIGFKEDAFDESKYARLTASHLKTDHYEKILTANDSLNLIPRISKLADEPLADASIIPTFLLSEFTKEHVTVALGGDGGDELFCGYDTFIAEQWAEFYKKIPLIIRKKILEKIILNFPTSFKNISFDFKAKKFIDGFYEDRKYRHQRWLGAFDSLQKQNLFSNDRKKELADSNEYDDIDVYLDSLKNTSDINKIIYLYLRMYMMDDILVKVDRASMFNSLEVRAPFLDCNVVDFANSLPADFKIKGFETKYILKKLMKNKLPKEIVWRKKKGFGIPMAYWLTNELKPLALELLNESRVKQEGLFNYQYVNKLLKNHFSKKEDNRKLIWSLMVFEMWREKWL